MATTPGAATLQFAANLRAARRVLGLTQSDVAGRMRNQGFPWTQGSVAQIESGHREVRLAEGEAVSLILCVPFDRMLTEPARQVARIAKENMRTGAMR